MTMPATRQIRLGTSARAKLPKGMIMMVAGDDNAHNGVEGAGVEVLKQGR